MKAKPVIVRILWCAVIVLALIGLAVAVRRTLHLFGGASAAVPQMAALDAGFARQRLLTMVHIVPGMLFLLLAPLQFVRWLRSRRPALHRWTGRIVLGAGTVIGATALAMSPRMAIGGATETAATFVFACSFLFALLRGLREIRRGNIAAHREWMIRAFAIGLAVATVRPIVGVFFATSRITHLAPRDFFGVAFWLGFMLHAAAAEAWIHYTRPQPMRRDAAFRSVVLP